jgi:hypothetical protein
MKDIVSELKDISLVYARLGEELSSVLDVDDSKDCRTLVESILEHRDCLARLKQINSTVLRLSHELTKDRSNLNSAPQDEVRLLVDAIRRQAIRLNELCGIHAQRLKSARDKLEKDLAELGRGALYLQSVKPAQNNYPKFIDSLY